MSEGSIFRSEWLRMVLMAGVAIASGIIISTVATWLGGPWMIPIALCGAVSLGLMAERYVALFWVHNIPMDASIDAICDAVADERLEDASRIVKTLPNEPIAYVAYNALKQLGSSEKELRRSVEEQVMRHSPTFQKRTSFLSVVANVATLLGLLGTIFGLIACFDAISAADPAQKQALLASGIATAMLTTAFGLIVAIPTLLVHAALSCRQNRLLDQFETASVRLFNQLSSVQLAQLRTHTLTHPALGQTASAANE